MKNNKRREIDMKNVKIFRSFKYAFQGIISGIKREKNMKIHLAIMIIVIIMGLLLKINTTEWMICIILFSITIAGELFNTAIEKVVDMITLEKNEKAKIAKDVSAGGVLVLSIGSAIIGIYIFMPKIIVLLINIISSHS